MVEVQVSRHPDLFAVKVGTVITIGPWIFRVVQVRT